MGNVIYFQKQEGKKTFDISEKNTGTKKKNHTQRNSDL